MIKKNLGTEDGVTWIELTSEDHDIHQIFDHSVFGITDHDTHEIFDHSVFGFTHDNQILDCDGFPCVEGDYQTIAVREFI